MAPGARNMFGAPIFEPHEVFRKQMYCFEKSACDIVVTFRSPAVIRRPRNCAPCTPSLRLWCYSIKIGKFSENKQIFKSERHELLFHEHLQFSRTIRHGSCTDCQQRLLAAFHVSSDSFCVTSMPAPCVLFGVDLCLFFSILKLSEIQQVRVLRFDKFENNFLIVLKAASAPEAS